MEGDGSDVPSAGQAGEAETDVPQKDDILLLADEKFDFDLSLSSLSANEDDEIFFGPVGHKERCIAASLELNTKIPEEPLLPASQSHFRWSPLPGEKFVEVYKEAHLLALQIESNSKNKAARAARPEDPWSQGVERFIQESKLKMNLFEKENEMKKSPKSLKRETYYLSDSPLLEPLLSGTQPLSGVGLQGSPAQASCTRPQGPPLSSCPLPVEPSPTHLPSQAVTQKKVISKLLPPRASSVRGKGIHLAVEKPMKEKPASPSGMKILNEKESHRDIPPDKPSAAQHVTGVPASGSHLVQGKRSLPVPSKLGLKKALPKPPGGAGRLARQSSSRGSAPGLASGARASPAAGRVRSRERPSIPANGSRPLSHCSRSGRWAGLQAGPAAVCRPSRWAGPAESTAEQPTVPTASALTQPPTPERGCLGLDPRSSLSRSPLNQTGSARRRGSALNSKTQLVPTPAHQFKIPKFAAGEPPDSATPTFSRSQRLQSCPSAGRAVVHSTPARRCSGPVSQSLRGAVRASALPTPASRRLSGFPPATPKTVPRAPASPLCVPARRLTSDPQKKSAVSSMRTEKTRRKGARVCATPQKDKRLPGNAVRIQYGNSCSDLLKTALVTGSSSRATARCSDSSDSSFSPPSAVPQALSFSPEKSDFTFSKSIAEEVALDEAQPLEDMAPGEAILVDIKLDQLTITPKAQGPPLADPPLIDFCNTPEASLARVSESRPLIDLLINTPDVDRNTVSKPPHEVGQLIDLCSPLIQLSPEADKENTDSPLLKF
ncbi:G2 and S phase-expressed protein 1 isoform X1 [Rousettus aegyptiacus]|nr:G2 and S phase-expressed protein 1 isoform X1 [Rousettus aegyptiacus]XP_036093564.1 G2 and S phase-expressed protein 1 isoform X1 [Rousettus aegyptiacus]XP_036093565.1 G2 and S phase-expressed protein 1 isoform X1 [Rousettus aegyptiacus]